MILFVMEKSTGISSVHDYEEREQEQPMSGFCTLGGQ